MVEDDNTWAESIGAAGTMDFAVTDSDTAAAVGSGVVPVLGTPILVAWLEATTLQVVEMPEHSVSLGVHIDVAHLAPSAIGTAVTCEAELVGAAGLRLTFRVAARNEDGTAIASGTIDRVVVQRERFLSRLQAG
ncbi:MAG: fluoroacetyl-CoA thioesterase [Actinomycetota bacterium]|nr:fluoroacetyl-CoA thioesterase [Actinomycetota bacterium]